jgi:CyaY protein
MTDQEFVAAAENVFGAIEAALDRSGVDIDTLRSGNVLQIEFDDGSKAIVNSQEPTREIWLAAKSGGFHYRYTEHKGTLAWHDTRTQEELFVALSRVVSQQSGETVQLTVKKSDL